MSLTIQQIIIDAKRLAGRLKERETVADALLTETHTVKKQIDTMKQYEDELESMSEAGRERSRGALVASIEREGRRLRDVQRENGELRAALDEHRHALNLIMTKYRQHTQREIWDSRVDFKAAICEKQQEVIRQQEERINEMITVMHRAAYVDDDSTANDGEILYQLAKENKGLREMLGLSQKYGSGRIMYPPTEDKDVQTDIIPPSTSQPQEATPKPPQEDKKETTPSAKPEPAKKPLETTPKAKPVQQPDPAPSTVKKAPEPAAAAQPASTSQQT